MALRFIEVFIDKEKTDELSELMAETDTLGFWRGNLADNYSASLILARAEQADNIIGLIEDRLGENENFRVVILPVEATIPRPPEINKAEESQDTKEKNKRAADRVSIEELYQKLSKECSSHKDFLVMTIVAAVVAGLGMAHNDMAVVIGSMVIAPLLGPNMALSLATSLGDIALAKKSAVVVIIGITISFLIGTVLGHVLGIDPSVAELSRRTHVRYYYLVLALFTGVAGSYSFTTGISQALVGVMVAVALLPPLVASGIFLGAGLRANAVGAILLFFVNIVSINLAGVVTFVLQGIRPRKYWEAEKARKGVVVAISMWSFLLIMLAVIILFEKQIHQLLLH